jgi:NADP-dependent 3-hydroxy acid dehydrogenase YdfG
MVCCSKYRGKARLDGKTAIVTGSNTGIGKYTALDFVKRGKMDSSSGLSLTALKPVATAKKSSFPWPRHEG